MEDLLKYLRELNPDFIDLVLQEIQENDTTKGYQCFARGLNRIAFSGGTSNDKETAIRIAVAEAFERSFVQFLSKNSKLKEEFDLVLFPSSSGFASGFNERQTRFRAICEGLERWIWSKWIDENYQLERFYPKEEFSPLTMHLLKFFKETIWYRKSFTLEVSESEKLNLCIVIFLGCTDDGIFPGSRVSSELDVLFEHPVIEAHRNFSNFQLNQSSPLQNIDIIQKRSIYFGTEKIMALKKISNAQNKNWPKPKIKLLKSFKTQHPNIYLYRCLLEDFIGWHEGDVTRFVY